MSHLFPRMWVSREGDICDTEGAFTKNFLQWCVDLAGVTNDQYSVAFNLLEQRCATAEADGKEYWPPSYAGFKGLCRTRKEHKTYRPEIGYSRDERNRKGKEGTSKLFEILAGATPMTDDEANRILDKAREDSLNEWSRNAAEA